MISFHSFAEELEKIAFPAENVGHKSGYQPSDPKSRKIKAPIRKEDKEPFYGRVNHEVDAYGHWGQDYANYFGG